MKRGDASRDNSSGFTLLMCMWVRHSESKTGQGMETIAGARIPLLPHSSSYDAPWTACLLRLDPTFLTFWPRCCVPASCVCGETAVL